MGGRLGGARIGLILKLRFHSIDDRNSTEVACLSGQLHQLPRMLAKSFALTSVDNGQGHTLGGALSQLLRWGCTQWMEMGRDQVGRPPGPPGHQRLGIPKCVRTGKKELEGRTRGELKVKTETVHFGGFWGVGGSRASKHCWKEQNRENGEAAQPQPSGVSAPRAGGWGPGKAPDTLRGCSSGHAASWIWSLKGSTFLGDT